jgi:hypothetical protein
LSAKSYFIQLLFHRRTRAICLKYILIILILYPQNLLMSSHFLWEKFKFLIVAIKNICPTRSIFTSSISFSTTSCNRLLASHNVFIAVSLKCSVFSQLQIFVWADPSACNAFHSFLLHYFLFFLHFTISYFLLKLLLGQQQCYICLVVAQW